MSGRGHATATTTAVAETLPSPAPWRALLDGELAERARRAVLAIAEALREPAKLGGRADGPGLSQGHSGRALFYTYLAASFAEPAWLEPAAEALDSAIEALAEQAVGPQLFGGFCGVGWTLEHLTDRLVPAAETADATDQIDEVLLDLLDGRWAGPYDLIGGLVGFGLYALEGLPRRMARDCLVGVVRELRSRGEVRDGGRAWFTPPRLLPEHQLEEAPTGYYNLGLAHGIAGVVAVLARARAAGVGGGAGGAPVPDLEAAVAWLLQQEQGPQGESCFANWVLPAPTAPVVPVTSRLAWCYGDLGIAAALRIAAEAVKGARSKESGPVREGAAGCTAWAETALRIARRAAARPDERSGVRDAGICHGAAGLALIFHRFAQATEDESLVDAARRSYARVLELRRPGEGVGGFRSWAPSRGGWEADGGFLTGAAGVGLTLLAGLTAVEPEWDRVLGISAPFGGERAAGTNLRGVRT